MKNSTIYNPALATSRLSEEAKAFGKPMPAPEPRSSAPETIRAPDKTKYPRREFYLKIEGLTGLRHPEAPDVFSVT